MSNLIADIKRREGFRSTPYRCTKNKLTVGYGFNLDAGMNKREATALLMIRLEDYRRQIRERLPIWDELSENRKDVLLHMAYALGVAGMFKFGRMISALKLKQYDVAAHEIMDSEVAREQPSRYQELSNLMIIG
jgi:lysozyme